MYSFPSTSQIVAPSARATKNGCPPTLRKAPPGELTPPGIRFSARENSSEEREFKGKQRRALNPPSQQLRRGRRRTSNAESAASTCGPRATSILSALAVWRDSQVVRLRSAKPLFAGSIPAPALVRCAVPAGMASGDKKGGEVRGLLTRTIYQAWAAPVESNRRRSR